MKKKLGIIELSSTSAFLVATGFGLAGCSIAGFGPDVDNVATTSIIKYEPPESLQETVDPSDWDKVRSVMADVLVSQPSGQPLSWENEVTGTVGTIVAMDVTSNIDGRFCRTFSTTINGVGGVSQYRGDACQQGGGDVELIDLAPHNAVVEISSPQTDQKI